MLILGPDVPVEDALRWPRSSTSSFRSSASSWSASQTRPSSCSPCGPASGTSSARRPEPAQIRVLLERACQSFASRTRTAAVKQPGRPKGLVIGVFSPKGGVGKTTIATNIAIGLGKVAPMGVVIVDLDLQFGDVASGPLPEPGAHRHGRRLLRGQPGFPGAQGLPDRPPRQHLCPLRPAEPGGSGRHHTAAGHPAAGTTGRTVPVRRRGHRSRAAGDRAWPPWSSAPTPSG